MRITATRGDNPNGCSSKPATVVTATTRAWISHPKARRKREGTINTETTLRNYNLREHRGQNTGNINLHP